ncbi:MAG: hypothetical protein GEV05_11315 [Betaproteobacteria bacterium]|nr:hypothetical protein [Betaproteobacteria bacterium]
MQRYGTIRIDPRDGRFISVVALAAILCAGCDTPQTRGEYPGEYPGAQQGERRDQFMCRDGEQIRMRFFDAEGIAVLSRRGRTVELKLQSTESGNIYSNGPTTVRSKGRDLRLQMEGMEPIECRSQRSD